MKPGTPPPSSLILRTATRALLPLMVLFSVFMVLRGHNEPGGGFIGGLVVSAAFSLYALAAGVQAARTALRVEPRTLIAFGLSISLLSGCVGAVLGFGYMTGVWLPFALPPVGKIGTPVLFDVGVYFTVVGVVLWMVFTLGEE